MITFDSAGPLSEGVARLRAERAARRARDEAASFPEPSLDPWTFVTTERLAKDAAALVARVPSSVDWVAAVPRSGLAPGAILAGLLHVPLVSTSRARGTVHVGSGVRLESTQGVPAAPKHVLIVDDTAARGGEMAAAVARMRAEYPGAELTRCVVYCHPQARHAVDLCSYLYPGLHYLEWNWPNAGHGALCGYDFDGILCTEDGRADPLYLPRRAPVPLIVTGRHESARALTLDWLARWGVRVDQLVMRDFDAPDHFDAGRIAAFKAERYAASACVLFAESDPWQAERIRDLTGRPVLCPAAGRVFPPREPLALPATRVGEPNPAVREPPRTAPRAEPALPAVADQLASAAGAVARTVLRAASGQAVLATADEQARRQAVCAACEHWRPSDARCSKCGCRTRAKLALAAESCPDGRWGPT